MLHPLYPVQALNQRDVDSRANVEMLLAWPAAQTELYILEVKQLAEYCALDPKHAESCAKTVQATWIKATSDLNKVCYYDMAYGYASTICTEACP
jgi:penicillin-binding protein-related factor A (putative recombinase)